jgi:hypothetical protein
MMAIDNIESVHNEATAAAEAAASKFFNEKLGGRDQYACGFAWVTVNEKASTRLGRALKSIGFRRAYNGGLQLWNPSHFPCQNVDTLEHGAVAYASVLKKYGIDAYADSRLD